MKVADGAAEIDLCCGPDLSMLTHFSVFRNQGEVAVFL